MRLFHADDLEEINQWYRVRGEHGMRAELLPEFGVIEPRTAAGFLYRTDAPGLGFLDGFVSNSYAPLRQRATALKDIAEYLIVSAQRQGVTQIVAICKSRGVERLAGRMGLRPIGLYAMLGKELRN